MSPLFLALVRISTPPPRFLTSNRAILTHDGFKVDKCAVIYGRLTNLPGPVRMALRGLLIALLGRPQRRFCAIKYIRAVKRSTVPVVRSPAQRRFGGSRSPHYSPSRISAVSRKHAIRSKAGLLRCTRDNATSEKYLIEIQSQ